MSTPLTAENPTAARLLSFSARRTSAGVVVVRWRIASQIDTAAFNLYRHQRGKLVKVNRTLIPSVSGGTTSGHNYSFLDRSARPGVSYTYRLQAVSLDGTRSWLAFTTAWAR